MLERACRLVANSYLLNRAPYFGSWHGTRVDLEVIKKWRKYVLLLKNRKDEYATDIWFILNSFHSEWNQTCNARSDVGDSTTKPAPPLRTNSF